MLKRTSLISRGVLRALTVLGVCAACSDYALTSGAVVSPNAGVYEPTLEGVWRTTDTDSQKIDFRFFDKWDGIRNGYVAGGYALLSSHVNDSRVTEYAWIGKAEVLKLASGRWLLDLQAADDESDTHAFKFRSGKPVSPRFQSVVPAFGISDLYSTGVAHELDLHMPMICALSAKTLSCKPFVADSLKVALKGSGANAGYVMLKNQLIVTGANPWTAIAAFEKRAGFLAKGFDFVRDK